MLRHQFLVWVVVAFSALPALRADVERTDTSSVKGKPKGEVIELNDENWEQILKGEWMVQFHAPWCPACRDFQPEFKRFAEWDRDLNLKAGSVDVQAHPDLSGRFLISALPTIFHVKDGEFRQYTGVRDRERMMSFIEQQDWHKLPPVSPWLKPTSTQMGVVGKFFKMSMQLKNLHTWMVEDQGIPNWVTYVIFGIATVTLGGLIGVLLVLIIENITGRRNRSSDKQKDTEGKIRSQKKSQSRSGSGRSRSVSRSGRSRSASQGTDQENGEALPESVTASDNEVISSGTDLEGTDEDRFEKVEVEASAESKAEGQTRRRKARREE